MEFFIGNLDIFNFFRPTGQKYDGQWKDGKQDGEGKFIDQNGKEKKGFGKKGKMLSGFNTFLLNFNLFFKLIS